MNNFYFFWHTLLLIYRAGLDHLQYQPLCLYSGMLQSEQTQSHPDHFQSRKNSIPSGQDHPQCQVLDHLVPLHLHLLTQVKAVNSSGTNTEETAQAPPLQNY